VRTSGRLTRSGVAPIFTHMGEYKSARLDGVFVALSDPTRRAILARLTDAPARVTEIAAGFPISLNSVSKHIRLLERAGLVRRRIRGREHTLSLRRQPLDRAAQWLDTHRRLWHSRLSALDRLLKAQDLAVKCRRPKASRRPR
jgi:DNA-binding transcriptional ArsR family regulator